ncbi:C39 family peptidase [bacterium]|nr:C39 family peptidase [bacterium]
MMSQPDDVTCGPTCLQAVYRFFGDSIDLTDLIAQVRSLETGGTLAALLGQHALTRGYQATLYTCNLRVFDPTWFGWKGSTLAQKLEEQAQAKSDGNLLIATRAYLGFLRRGGAIRSADITRELLANQLRSDRPIITGLSATWLHHSARERMWDEEYDDIRGTSAGHFVVINGYDESRDEFCVLDPLLRVNGGRGGEIHVPTHRLTGAIFLGVLTHDADLLVLKPNRAGN